MSLNYMYRYITQIIYRQIFVKYIAENMFACIHYVSNIEQYYEDLVSSGK